MATAEIDLSLSRNRYRTWNVAVQDGAPLIEQPAKSLAVPQTDFVCYGGAKDLWTSVLGGEAAVMLHGPAETGKTISALHLVHHLCSIHPGLQAAIIRKVANDLWGSVIHDFEKKVIKMEDGVSPYGVTKYGGEKPEFYTYWNKSKIWVGGMDHPGKILSAQRDLVYTNQTEEFEQNDWETISTRTTGRAGVLKPGRLIGDCNPGPSTHWIIGLAEAGALKMLKSNHKDNPTLFDPQTGEMTPQGVISIGRLQKLQGVRYKRLYLGLWVAAEGVVYETWDPTTHCNVDKPWGDIIYRVVGVDWGLTNPGILQVWGVDGDGRMYREEEVYQTGKLVAASKPEDAWWVIKAKELMERHENIRVFVADPSRPDNIEVFRGAGIPCDPAYNTVDLGIQNVQSRLKVQSDGHPRIALLKGSKPQQDKDLLERHAPTCLEEEVEVYAYPKDSQGKDKKENPVEKDNHACDAMRYAAAWVDGLGETQFMFGHSGEE